MERAEGAIETRVAKGLNFFWSNIEFRLGFARASHNSLLVDSLRYALKEIRIQLERRVREVVGADTRASAERQPALPGMQQQNLATVVEHRAISAVIHPRGAAAARQAMAKQFQHPAALPRRYGQARL